MSVSDRTYLGIYASKYGVSLTKVLAYARSLTATPCMGITLPGSTEGLAIVKGFTGFMPFVIARFLLYANRFRLFVHCS